MMTMSFRRIFLLVFAATVCSVSARAQFGAYGVVTGERVGGFTCRDPQQCASSDGNERPYGGTIGGYYDFRTFVHLRFGGDLRAMFLNANKSAIQYSAGPDIVRHYSLLAGPRVTFPTPIKALHPYAEVVGGYSRYAEPFNASSGSQVEAFVGVDIALGSVVDFRAIELGAGEIFGVQGSSHSSRSIGIGIVFHTSREDR
jgi:hypothetical protein